MRHIRPFEVLERVDTIAYQLTLSPSLLSVHAVFHVSMLRKYTPDSTHVVNWGELVVDAGQVLLGSSFARQDCEASEGVVTAPRSRGGNMGT